MRSYMGERLFESLQRLHLRCYFWLRVQKRKGGKRDNASHFLDKPKAYLLFILVFSFELLAKKPRSGFPLSIFSRKC